MALFINPISLFDTSFFNLPHLECATRIMGIGDAFSVHQHYQEVPKGVSHGTEVKALGVRYHDLTYEVMTGALGKKAERDAAGEEAKLAASLLLNWAGMRYLKEKNFAYITNVGVDHKKKAPARSSAPVLVGTTEKLRVEHAKISGALHLFIGKVDGAITYIVQVCQGDPNDESAWGREWQFTKIKGGVELAGLEPGKVYYIRVRCLGHAGLGPWSSYVHIMVI